MDCIQYSKIDEKELIMKKNTFISLGMILFGAVASFINLSPDYFALQIKLGFAGKMSLLVGLISFWLFTVLPYWAEKKDKIE